jgi:hypothetical protein
MALFQQAKGEQALRRLSPATLRDLGFVDKGYPLQD